ncbi:MAG TPA: dihydrofolate reductase, partial [Gammaproteobacteria bacterium]|nr:dihydrofolate reductase [Gammaproteobacteria bacterium]
MMISLIWAMSDDGVIGVDNRLPWKLPADMRWF